MSRSCTSLATNWETE